jgi:serine/threonine protein phosphatase PrpC
VRLARDELRTYADASMASEKLVEVALKRYADDNVTAVVVLLNSIADVPTGGDDARRGRPLLASRRRGASLADLVAAEEAAKTSLRVEERLGSLEGD